MSELRDLYQEVILDHGRHPRNNQAVDPETVHAHGHNPLCGDRLRLSIRLDPDGKIEKIGFTGSGCAISTASASILTQVVEGLGREEVEALFKKFQDLVTSDIETPVPDDPALGKLLVFAGVREFPVRIKCATLAWHTLHSALEGDSARPATTE